MWIVDRCDELDFLGGEYAQLYERSSATLFQHPMWLHHLYEDLVPQVGADPVIVSVRDEDGLLVAVLPLVRRHTRRVNRVEFADLGVSDYAAPVIADGVADALADSRTHTGTRMAIGRADLVRVDKATGDPTPFASILGARKVRAHHYETHAIALEGTLESWRESLQPEFVRHLDRKRKRLAGAGRVVDVREIHSLDEIDPAFDRMREFRQARFADRRAIDLVQDDRYDSFYRAVARQSAVRGGPGSTTVLTVNDDIVAVSFCLQDLERDLFLLIGYDIERFRNYALGLLLVEDLIAASFANNKRVHDLTLGHDDYKKSFGATAAPVYSVRAPLTMRGRIAQLGADQEASARRLAKRALAFQERRLPQLDAVSVVRRLRR